jgi:hypothetical protein
VQRKRIAEYRSQLIVYKILKISCLLAYVQAIIIGCSFVAFQMDFKNQADVIQKKKNIS